ncbi:MAG: RyR domain-containing protein [Rikenellaceae bacterium]
MYIPKPLNTEEVTLPAELEQLTEAMSKNVHEQWSAGRIADGWVYGSERNDALRTTPCLVPYEQLSEEEREYDRATALATLKFIVASGFDIVKR